MKTHLDFVSLLQISQKKCLRKGYVTWVNQGIPPHFGDRSSEHDNESIGIEDIRGVPMFTFLSFHCKQKHDSPLVFSQKAMFYWRTHHFLRKKSREIPTCGETRARLERNVSARYDASFPWDTDHHWLVVSAPLKNISQLGRINPICYGKIKNVPNHQPV